MNTFFFKLLCFLKKDFRVESSYKLSFLFNIFSVLVTLLGYYYIDLLFGKRMVAHLEAFGVSYFSYVLLSMALFSYVGIGLGSFAGQIRSEQVQGTLEAILVTPTSLPTLLFSLALWNLVIATIDLAVYLLLGIFLFGIDFSHINIIAAFTVFFLTITSFSGLGILSAAFTIVLKRGNPMSWIISSLEGLLGGVYFPISVLPFWLQIAAQCLPITYAIRAVQLAVYKGYGLGQLSREVGFLLFFSAVLLPLSLWVFRKAVRRAKSNGSLAQY